MAVACCRSHCRGLRMDTRMDRIPRGGEMTRAIKESRRTFLGATATVCVALLGRHAPTAYGECPKETLIPPRAGHRPVSESSMMDADVSASPKEVG
jgi:hypothetical protein